MVTKYKKKKLRWLFHNTGNRLGRWTYISPKNSELKLLSYGRIILSGNWTSWPPHEHSETREEIYLYISMPKPSFGIQLVYTDLDKMKFVEIVRENDVVIIHYGYHPNVACPGYSINYAWFMAGKQPIKDRVWANVKTQSEFSTA